MTAARERQILTYQTVADQMRLEPPHTIQKVALLLEALMEHHARQGAPQLASLVAGRRRNGLPGPGFFEKMSLLGLYAGPDDGAEAETLVNRLRAEVFAAASREEKGNHHA